jgi:hypothetical protein
MKTITLAEALDILSSCVAVQVDGSFVSYPNVVDEYEDDEIADTNEVLRIGRDTNDDSPLSFIREQGEGVAISEQGELVLRATDGYDYNLMPLVAAPVTPPLRYFYTYLPIGAECGRSSLTYWKAKDADECLGLAVSHYRPHVGMIGIEESNKGSYELARLKGN